MQTENTAREIQPEAIETPRLRLYITHLRVRNDEGDCEHLARQLRLVGLDVIYDPIEVRPGINPWDRVASRLAAEDKCSWVYLLTPKWLSDRECREGLLETLDLTSRKKGPASSPPFGLLHGVAIQDLPPALKLRPFVHVADPDWKEQVKTAVIDGFPPRPHPKHVCVEHKPAPKIGRALRIELIT